MDLIKIIVPAIFFVEVGGKMKLKEWYELSGYKKKFLINKLHITARYFDMLCKEETTPSFHLAHYIEMETGGKVKVKDLIIEKEEFKTEEK